MLTSENYILDEYFKVEITLQGCDDNTCFEMEVTLREYMFLKTVGMIANNTSEYRCQPRMYVEKVNE